jgi:hypothetical protein
LSMSNTEIFSQQREKRRLFPAFSQHKNKFIKKYMLYV